MKEQEFEIRRDLISIQYQELSYHRRRQSNIFSVTSSMIYAVLALLVVNELNDEVAQIIMTDSGKLMLSFIIIFTAVFSYVWQRYHFNKGNKHKVVIVKMWKSFGLFPGPTRSKEKNNETFVLQKNWETWGCRDGMGFWEKFWKDAVSRQSVTIYQATLVLFLIWLRG